MTDGLGRWSGWVALVWAATYLYLGLAAQPPVPELRFVGVDLLGHAAASGLLAMLTSEWLLVRRDLETAMGFGAAATASFAVGVAIEIFQTGSATRSFEGLDLLADAVGVAVGVLLYHLASRRLANRRLMTNGLVGLGVLGFLLTVWAASAAPR